MPATAEFLIALGSILMLAIATDFVGKHTLLPRVTLLLIFGIVIGDQVLGLIPTSVSDRFDIITKMTLLMVGFLLGGKLTLDSFRQQGRQLLLISFFASIGTTVIVTLLLISIGVALEIAILLGCIAAATAPAATVDIILESNHQGPFSRLLMGIVAIDDVWALIMFSFGLAAVSLLNGMETEAITITSVGYEIIGAILVGGLIGLPASYLTGRISPGQPMLTEALGLVFLCGGLAIWLDVSFLIASMVMGMVIANLAKHHEYPFHEIENIEWPFMAIFFILAGALLQVDMLAEIGLIGIVYLLARVIGKLIGAWLGARVSHAESSVQRWMGVALLPQAGVAIGMALLTADRFPEYRQVVLSIVVGTTIFFEIIGPVCTRIALKRAD